MDKTPVPYNPAVPAAATNNWNNAPNGIQAETIQNLTVNFPAPAVSEVIGAQLASMYGTAFGSSLTSHAMEWFELSHTYYCLFVLENECYNNGVFSIAKSRALERYTHTDAQKLYQSLQKEAVEELKHMPCIFAKRNYHFGYTEDMHPALVGRLTDIAVQHETIKFSFVAFSTPIPQQLLNIHAKELCMATSALRNELDEEHWSIKNCDLIQAMTDLGVHIN